MSRVAESLGTYIPMDRRQALAQGTSLPGHVQGAALFADVSGFTALTEVLANELGPRRGAETLTRHLNRLFDALIEELHRYGGSVMGFAGDAITCWLDGDFGLRATACALAMQGRMGDFSSVTTPSGKTMPLAMKAAVATGAARRFMVGEPDIHIIDVLAGTTLDRLADAEHLAGRGEVILDHATVTALGDQVQLVDWRTNDVTGERFATVKGLTTEVSPSPWQSGAPETGEGETLRPWLLPPVYERLRTGRGEFLAELRPAVTPLFLRFGGIDYDGDEEAGDKLDAFIRWVQTVVVGYEGYMLHLSMGDKGSYLSAGFGAPITHEDDAVRAVSAALELQALPPELDFIERPQIGISQGRTLATAYGGTTRRTYGVLGDIVNLAARLMQAAAPGQILVSQTVQHVSGDTFVWQDLPAIRVKGKTEPVTVFSPVRARRRRAISLAEREYSLPMVGREAELALIEEKLALVLEGRGQIVGITGEAGVGKSRLVAEVIRAASDRQLTGYASECESYGTNTSYMVWWPIWRAFFNVDPAWEAAEQISVLESELEQIDPALVPRLPLLGAALNLTIPDNDLTRTFDAKLRKTSLEALLVDCLRARARTTPMFFVLEDSHWLDPLSHDLAEVIGRAVADLPVLLVLAYRPPELERLQAPRVSQLAHFTGIRLVDFTPEEAKRLIALKLEQFSGPQAEVPQTLVERITSRAEGNPFYIEQLLNYLRDQGISPQDSRALERLDLPTSLHSLILSRLDQRTESQKITLRVASVVGRLFRAAWLWGMYPDLGTSERIKADLEALCRLDLTQADTPEPELAYIFRHIVTQEVAYESLPYATRAILHEQLAQFVERAYSQSVEQFVDLLAYHYEHTDNEDKKREYLLKAGEAAQADYANEAAISYYQRVLPLLPPEERAPVMLKLGLVLQLVGQWDEANELCQEGMALAEQLGDQQTLARCQTAKGRLLWRQSQYAEALTWLERARVVFEELGDQSGVGDVLKWEGTLGAVQGNLEEARTLWERSLAIRQELNDEEAIADLLNNLAIVARNQGDYEKSRALNEEALALRRRLGDRRKIAVSLNNLGQMLTDLGEYETARSHLEVAVQLQREIGDRWEIANALHTLATATRDQGDYVTSLSQFDESLTILWELGERWMLAYVLEDMGGLAALQGQAERALRLAGAASAVLETIDASFSPTEQDQFEQMLAPARQALGEAAAAAAEAAGRAMSLEGAVEYARSYAA